MQLNEWARQRIAELCKAAPGIETGGVLIGDGVMCQEVTGPGPHAELAERSLEWDAAYIQGVIDGVALSGSLDVIGRWHKHASPIILPSKEDRAGAEAFRSCIAPNSTTVELIVACDSSNVPMAMAAYECTRDGLTRIW